MTSITRYLLLSEMDMRASQQGLWSLPMGGVLRVEFVAFSSSSQLEHICMQRKS